VKSPANAPRGAQIVIKNTLLTPQQNHGKDRYTIDLVGPETTYWLGTESGLLGAFHFDGTCTVGDGSCDVVSFSMGEAFCNLSSLKWLAEEPLTPTHLHEQRTKQSHKVGREEEDPQDNETTLLDINKWIGGGTKLSLTKTVDADILRAIVIKLH
jgi:hypothetical protein